MLTDVVMNDLVSPSDGPVYEIDKGITSVVVGADGDLCLQNTEEITIPLTHEERDWEQLLMQMIRMCGSNTVITKNLNHKLWSDVNKMFDDSYMIPDNVIANPKQEINVPEGMNLHQTELCPLNRIYVLLPKHYMGAMVSCKERGKGLFITNTDCVVKIVIDPNHEEEEIEIYN